MRALEVVSRVPQRSKPMVGRKVERGLPELARNFEVTKLHAIQLGRQGQERGISVAAHSLQDLRDPGLHGDIIGAASLQQRAAVRRGQSGERADVAYDAAAHGISLSILVTRIPSAPSALSAAMVR